MSDRTSCARTVSGGNGRTASTPSCVPPGRRRFFDLNLRASDRTRSIQRDRSTNRLDRRVAPTGIMSAKQSLRVLLTPRLLSLEVAALDPGISALDPRHMRTPPALPGAFCTFRPLGRRNGPRCRAAHPPRGRCRAGSPRWCGASCSWPTNRTGSATVSGARRVGSTKRGAFCARTVACLDDARLQE